MQTFEDWRQPVRVSLQNKPRHLRPPGDTLWSAESDFEKLCFRRKGLLHSNQFFPLLLFAGGVTAFYVFMLLAFCDVLPGCVPENMPGWQKAILLIAVGAFELLFFYALVRQIFEAVHVQIREFSHGQARYADRYFGLGRTKTVTIDHCTELEIRLSDDDWTQKEYEELRKNRMLSELDWIIVLLDRSGREILAMNSRWDKKEALWVADMLLQEKSLVFSKQF